MQQLYIEIFSLSHNVFCFVFSSFIKFSELPRAFSEREVALPAQHFEAMQSSATTIVQHLDQEKKLKASDQRAKKVLQDFL